MTSQVPAGTDLCEVCGRVRPRFNIARLRRCLRCTLSYRPLLRRSFFTALVVGTILTAINQGNLLLSGEFPAALYWKIPLTYTVPFCVATWGALINSRILPEPATAPSEGVKHEPGDGRA